MPSWLFHNNGDGTFTDVSDAVGITLANGTYGLGVLTGDFNNWHPTSTPLASDESGLWLTEIQPPQAGRYRYKFIVDSQKWIEDQNNGMKEPDHYGGLNSILVIK